MLAIECAARWHPFPPFPLRDAQPQGFDAFSRGRVPLSPQAQRSFPMPRTFPSRFSLDALSGRRAGEFSDREDAFQQLVGDGLKAMFGAYANVTRTRGRDGGIDAYVTEGASGCESLGVSCTPVIIECKDHDDTLGNVHGNMERGWKKVAEKLRRQAMGGWQGPYAPWRSCRAYVYCVSAQFPHVASRQEFEDEIKAFFRSLSADRRPLVEEVRVLDWSDLRALLNDCPRCVDAWMGSGLETVVEHAQFVSGLTGFLDLLREDRLPFVPPPAADAFHPKRILDRLGERAGQGGVLLTGVGGVGKTRTALEAASRAAGADWRVLHVLPAAGSLRIDELAAAVCESPGTTLLVFDYLERVQPADLQALRERLFPQARRSGVQLAVLASSRFAGKPPTGHDWSLFATVEVRPDERHRDDIRRRMLATVAPEAWRQLGDEALRLCGERPIIALFIARELEARAQDGGLDVENLASLRGGDLAQWLQRRFAEDHLLPQASDSRLEAGMPRSSAVAAAAALACAPQPRRALAVAAAAAFETFEQDHPDVRASADYVVERLVEWGWLEVRDSEAAAPHDAVADELLQALVLDGETVRERVLNALLEPAARTVASLARVSVSLDRVIESLPREIRKSVRRAAGQWAKPRADDLVKMLADGDVGEVSLTLGALIGSDAWRPLVLESWDSAVMPYLWSDPGRREARHVLFMGLRTLTEGHAGRLVPYALEWLAHNGSRPEAEYILHALLSRKDLKPDDAAAAIDLALRWLKSNGRMPGADFLIRALLHRRDLPGKVAATVVRRAEAWAFEFQGTREEGYVLSALLETEALPRERVAPIADRALRWLELFGDTQQAGLVLCALLEHEELAPEVRERAEERSFAWLGRHGKAEVARPTLTALMKHVYAGSSRGPRAVARALEWLDVHSLKLDAESVLGRLVERPDLPEVGQDEVLARARTWLARWGTDPSARFLLAALVNRHDLPRKSARETVEAALRWLDHHAHTPEAEYVLTPLLRRPGLSDRDRQPVREAAVQHLRVALSTDRVSGAETRYRPGSEKASFLLQPLLQDRNLPEALERETLELAFRWLDRHVTRDSAEFVFNGVLRRDSVDPKSWRRAATVALAWLAERRGGDMLDYAVNALLSRFELLEDREQDDLVETALRWLRTHDQSTRAAKLREALKRAVVGTRHESMLPRPQDAPVPRKREPPGARMVARLRGVPPGSAEEWQALRESLDDLENTANLSPTYALYDFDQFLAVGSRLGPDAIEKIVEVASPIIRDFRVGPSNRRGIYQACIRAEAENRIDSSVEVRALLARLGLNESGEIVPGSPGQTTP